MRREIAGGAAEVIDLVVGIGGGGGDVGGTVTLQETGDGVLEEGQKGKNKTA